MDIRSIAATNRDLKAAILDGAFRQDLYYRLKVVSLAADFSRLHERKAQRRIEGVSDAALAALMQYDWPGNVRELDNAIERAVVLSAGNWILPRACWEFIRTTSIG